MDERLSRLGFRSVQDFQAAYNLATSPLKVDGIIGPVTSAALNRSVSTGLISPHFAPGEFRCRCGGHLPGCRNVLVVRGLLQSLENLRERHYRGGLTITSGYRCPKHNADPDVGGAKDSAHMRGVAVDIRPAVPWRYVRNAGLFAGIGYDESTGHVSHVDRRDLTPTHARGATLADPAVWSYNR